MGDNLTARLVAAGISFEVEVTVARSAQRDQDADGETGRQQPHDGVEAGAHAGNTSPSRTATATEGSGRDAGPSATSPVAESNWLP